jgi:cytochrome c-type biogenesis protein CcmH/NrfF
MLRIIIILMPIFMCATTLAPDVQTKAMEIAKKLRCPVCQGEPLSESQSPLANAMRSFIITELKNGKNEPEILAELEKKYGTNLYLSPPLQWQTFLLWLSPFIILIGAWYLFFRFDKVK